MSALNEITLFGVKMLHNFKHLNPQTRTLVAILFFIVFLLGLGVTALMGFLVL